MPSRYFRTILIDPPWPERGGGRSKRGADRHYKLLAVSRIAEVIRRSPLWRPASAGCHLWIWATVNYLRAALRVMEQLGFRYVTSAVWVKLGRFGIGQYLRVQHEHLLLGRMGTTMLPPTGSRPSSLIVAPRREHSRKPEAAYNFVETVSPGPRAELFARHTRPGWAVWGDEIQPREDESTGPNTRRKED